MVWMGVFLAVAVASAAQTLSGFGYALIATPLVAVLVGPKEAVVGLTIAGLLLVAQLALRDRGSIVRRVVLLITLSAFVGMPLGLLVLDRADERTLTLCIAIAVIAFALLLWRGMRLPARPATDAIAGFTAGVLSTSTGTSGPPIVVALSAKDLLPSQFRSTISTIFLIQGAVSLIGFAAVGRVTGEALSVALAAVPGVLLGAFAGERAFRRLDREAFRRVVTLMLLISGMVALGGALAS